MGPSSQKPPAGGVLEGFPRGNAARWTNIVDGGEHDGKDRLQCRNAIGADPPGGKKFVGRDPRRPYRNNELMQAGRPGYPLPTRPEPGRPTRDNE